MPLPYQASLPLWVHACKKLTLTENTHIDVQQDENLMLQVIHGEFTCVHEGVSYPQTARSIIFLGRESAVDLVCEPGRDIQYYLLSLRHAASPVHFDINRLCIMAPSVDAFFSQKTRFCCLTDSELIYAAVNELYYEWNRQLDERDILVRELLTAMMIKLARAFSSQHHQTTIKCVTVAKNYIAAMFRQPITLDDVAKAAAVSRSYITVLFSHYVRRSIVEYIQTVRCDHAAHLLTATRFGIIDIALDSGFNSRQHFTRVFKKFYAMSPMEYRLMQQEKKLRK